jgi:hypothetical protein
MRLVKNLILIFVLAGLLSSCAGITSQIGSSPLLCCPGDYQNYSEYGLRTEGLPLFLRDYVLAEFERAFDQKGLSRNDQAHDIEVVLVYNHINFYPDQQNIDPFIRMESLNVELSYIAEINIEIAETVTREKVWAGAISRIHQVAPGEYVHEERASPEFYEAFARVLENYPVKE